MIRWILYPNSNRPDSFVYEIIEVFEKNSQNIDSNINKKQESDVVLGKIRADLEEIGFNVEKGKAKKDKIYIPVLFGLNGKVTKYFEADAYNKESGWVLEVEAGRAYTNYQFLKDLFQASVMHGVNYLCIAVRNVYRERDDFLKIKQFFDALYASGRFYTPLNAILLVGY